MRGLSRRSRHQEEISHARLDMIFLMLFPLFFLLFNFVYWGYFMQNGDCSNCGKGGIGNDSVTTDSFPVEEDQNSP